MCSLRRSSAWADTATARFFPREERFSGTGSQTFPKVRQGGLPALPSTLESPRDLVKPCKLLGLARGELGAHLSISTPLPKFFWGTSAGWRRGSSSRSRKKPLPSSTKRGSPFRTAEHVVGETITPLPPDTQFLIVFKDARQAGGALSGELAQVLDCDLTPPVPAADPPHTHTPTSSGKPEPPQMAFRQKPRPSSASRPLVEIRPKTRSLGQTEPKGGKRS